MEAQRSMQLATQPRLPPKKPYWLSIFITVVSILPLMSFIGTTFFWIGLIQNKLPDTLGAILGFIALIIAIPPFNQYFQERRSAPPISAIEPEVEPTLGARTTSEHQAYLTNDLTNAKQSGTFLNPVNIDVIE